MSTLDLSGWSEQQLAILLAVTLLGIVLVIIALLWYIRRGRVQNAVAGAKETGDGASQQAPPEILLRRKHWTGPLELVLNGRAYRRMKDIDDASLRRAVYLAVSDLATFAGMGPTSGEPEPAREPAGQAALDQPEQADLGAGLQPGWTAPPVVDPYRTLVDGIEAILQRRLKEAGVTTEAHLRADSQGVVHLEVEGVRYESPADIPDATIRELIRASVGEWEARS